MNDAFNLACSIGGYAVLAAFIALTVVEALRYFKTALEETPVQRSMDPARPLGKIVLEALIALAISRALIIGIIAICYYATNHQLLDFGNALSFIWKRWDAGQYLPLIEHGYLTEGDERLRIVFLPLYPMLCRFLCDTSGISPFACATLVSNICLVVATLGLSRLAQLEYGDIAARRVIWITMFCPVTFFFSQPFSESLFLMLTVLAVLFARQKRWALAVFFGALATNTRILGMAVAIPIFWEMLKETRVRCAANGIALKSAAFWVRATLCILGVLPVALGLLAYLNLNRRLFGDPFMFLTFQRENWFQRFGSLNETFRYTLYNAFTFQNIAYRTGTWGPQLVALVGVPLLVFLRRKRSSASDSAYALVYHYISYAPTWLLSGMRYTSGMYALYLLLAGVAESRKSFFILFGIETILLIYMVVAGPWVGFVL